MSDELKAIRIQAETFAREHVVECATELLEWSNTGLLRDGRVRELAKTLEQLDQHHSLTLAERFATRAALEHATAPAQTEPVGWFVQRSKFGPWIEVEQQEPGAEQFHRAAAQPASGGDRE